MVGNNGLTVKKYYNHNNKSSWSNNKEKTVT